MPTRGRRGSRQLWALLSERTGDPDERANAWENLMARLLRGSDLPVPVRQQKVEVDGHVHYLDFAFPAQMVAVECDSLEWHSTSQQLLHDLDRQHRCESAGWAFKRFVKSQALADPAGTVAKVRSLMVERGWSPANY
jgi:very-short-patch-repair endonuclease